MQPGVIKFRLVDAHGAIDKKEVWFDGVHNHTGMSPWQYQVRFLKALRDDGYEPFESDDQGFQYWRRK